MKRKKPSRYGKQGICQKRLCSMQRIVYVYPLIVVTHSDRNGGFERAKQVARNCEPVEQVGFEGNLHQGALTFLCYLVPPIQVTNGSPVCFGQGGLEDDVQDVCLISVLY